MSTGTFEVRIGEDAERDLDDVAAWYEQRHPRGHERFLAELRRTIRVLAAFPLAGRLRPELHPRVRSLPLHPFVLFFVVDEAAKRVTIAHILHGHRDIDDDDFHATDEL